MIWKAPCNRLGATPTARREQRQAPAAKARRSLRSTRPAPLKASSARCKPAPSFALSLDDLIYYSEVLTWHPLRVPRSYRRRHYLFALYSEIYTRLGVASGQQGVAYGC